MNEYRVKGLSCGNCARELEQQIRQLEYGETAVLSYNSGKLKADSRIPVDKLQRILKSDGAYIDNADAPPEAACGHNADGAIHAPSHDDAASYEGGKQFGHDHGHSHARGGGKTLKLVIASAVLYAAALLLEQWFSEPVLIIIFILAAGLSGYNTFVKGFKNLLRLRFNIDTLMTVALIGAAAIGEWKEASLVAILFGVNELLEGYGMEKTRRSVESLLKNAPSTALRLEAGGGYASVPVQALAAGDKVWIKPGSKIPSDGTVYDGESSVNEAAITGEPLPVDKRAGDRVFGGSLNNEGSLHVRIDKAYEDSSLSKILHLVEEAQDTKTPTELFINRFANYYTPFIMVVALLVMLMPPLLFGGEWHRWLYQGLSVLIVGCPCALILASPIAIVSGIARNARNGVLVKGGTHLEQLGKIEVLAFDKTGTLTKGEPHVRLTEVYDEERFYRAAGAIEEASSHPLAKAVMKEIGARGVRYPKAERLTTLPGSGIEAVVEGRLYRLGSEAAIRKHGIVVDGSAEQTIGQWKRQGLTLVLVADEERILGMFGIADEIREESRETVAALHRCGVRRTVMLTGDHAATAQLVSDAVGVTEFYAGLLPEQKAEKIRELSKQGTTAMVGDGINDAPALASATLGIAMGKGTDSAIETADIVLMQDHLGKLPGAIKLSKRINRLIRFNIGIALGLKLIALLLTIPGWLTLWIAILSDMGATVLVTLASLTVLIEFNKRSRFSGNKRKANE